MSRYYYFPKMPLDVCTPSNAERYLKIPGWLENTIRLRNNPKVPDSYILKSMEEEGQLDPLLVKLSGDERIPENYDKFVWIVEPGQGRWYCLKYLGEKYTFILVKVDEDEASQHAFKKHLEKHEHIEIKSFKEVLPLFKKTNEHSHTGPGYLKRRGWFSEENKGK